MKTSKLTLKSPSNQNGKFLCYFNCLIILFEQKKHYRQVEINKKHKKHSLEKKLVD